MILFLMLVGGVISVFAGILGEIGYGVTERDTKYRVLSMFAIVPIAMLSFAAFWYFVLAWPAWLALPAGVAVLAAGVALALVLVNRTLPKKMGGRGE